MDGFQIFRAFLNLCPCPPQTYPSSALFQRGAIPFPSPNYIGVPAKLPETLRQPLRPAFHLKPFSVQVVTHHWVQPSPSALSDPPKKLSPKAQQTTKEVFPSMCPNMRCQFLGAVFCYCRVNCKTCKSCTWSQLFFSSKSLHCPRAC